MGVANIQEDPLCPACGEQEETSFHFLGECCPNMQIRYSTFEAHLMQPSTLLWFLRATKKFSWPLVAMGMCIGPTVSTASELSVWQLLTPKKRWKAKSVAKTVVYEQHPSIHPSMCLSAENVHTMTMLNGILNRRGKPSVKTSVLHNTKLKHCYI